MDKRNRNVIIILSVIMLVSMIASVYICIRSLKHVASENSENMSSTIATMVEDAVSNELLRPIMVTETMSTDYHLRSLMKQSAFSSTQSIEKEVGAYLNSIRSGFGYQMVYAVCGESKAYYTYKGICKYIDVENDEHDIWYKDFLECGKHYDLNVDTDEANNWALSVFVNMEVNDEQGNLLGVCGIGVSMETLQKVLQSYEERYDIKINLIDASGLIQVDTDGQRIETTYLDNSYLSSVDGENIFYERNEKFSRATVYMEALDWYLVVTDNHPDKIDVVKVIRPSIIIFIFGVMAMGVTFGMMDKLSSLKGKESGLKSLGDIYVSMHLLDLSTLEIRPIKSTPLLEELMDVDYKSFNDLFLRIFNEICAREYLQTILEFTDVTTLKDRIAGKPTIYCDFYGKVNGWCRARFIASGDDGEINDYQYIFAVEVINEEKDKENALKHEAEEARVASDAKGKFLANMSHEIRTPINAILGMDTMILRESTEPLIKTYALDIQEAGHTLLSLINDILDFSKIESGKMEIVPTEYDFSSMIHDVLNMITIKAAAKGLEVKLDIDKNLPSRLYGDDIRIRQILVNIMNNAVKYTEKGSITLTIRGEMICDGAMLHFSIKDTGIGIKKEDMSKLFADFERIEEARNKNVEGTGLGMSITVRLLALMGSELGVESVYGEGSEFYFDLEQGIKNIAPIGEFVQNLQDRSKKYDYNASFIAPDARVLVVDDNATNLMVFADLLKETEIQVDKADCGLAALDLITKNYYDVIFLDHMMPEMDGIEVMQKIRKIEEHPNKKTPIVILTANAISGVREEYLAAGFNEYLSKPIIPEKLEKLLEDFISSDKKRYGERKKREEKKEETETLDDMPMIEGINWNYGLLHLTKKDILLATVKSFYQSIDSEAEYLEKMYHQLQEKQDDSEAMELYRIKVHAMKSSASLIGAFMLAGTAAMLEFAARESKIETIIKVTPSFLENWRSYKEKMRVIIEVDEQSNKQTIEDKTHIIDYLEQVMFSMENFDIHSADAAIECLNAYEYPPELKQILDNLTVAVNNLDTDSVEEFINEMKQGVEELL